MGTRRFVIKLSRLKPRNYKLIQIFHTVVQISLNDTRFKNLGRIFCDFESTIGINQFTLKNVITYKLNERGTIVTWRIPTVTESMRINLYRL